jgi:hypothetical protein
MIFISVLKRMNNCWPTRSATKKGTRVCENPIEKKHEDQNIVNLLVLLKKKLCSEIIFYFGLPLRREIVQSRKEDNSK